MKERWVVLMFDVLDHVWRRRMVQNVAHWMIDAQLWIIISKIVSNVEVFNMIMNVMQSVEEIMSIQNAYHVNFSVYTFST